VSAAEVVGHVVAPQSRPSIQPVAVPVRLSLTKTSSRRRCDPPSQSQATVQLETHGRPRHAPPDGHLCQVPRQALLRSYHTVGWHPMAARPSGARGLAEGASNRWARYASPRLPAHRPCRGDPRPSIAHVITTSRRDRRLVAGGKGPRQRDRGPRYDGLFTPRHPGGVPGSPRRLRGGAAHGEIGGACNR
jgi:hypothetical protein